MLITTNQYGSGLSLHVMQDPLHVLPLFCCFDNFIYLQLKTYMIMTHMCRYIVQTYTITHLCTIISLCFHVNCTIKLFLYISDIHCTFRPS